MKTNLYIVFLFILSVLPICVGCSDGKPKRIPVSGTVKFEGLEQPANGTIYFAPVTAKLKRPAFANFDSSGSYTVTSFGLEKGDGLLPGTYKVYVEAYKTMPTPENPNPPSFVPTQYMSADKTPLELSVPEKSGRIHQDFTITK